MRWIVDEQDWFDELDPYKAIGRFNIFSGRKCRLLVIACWTRLVYEKWRPIVGAVLSEAERLAEDCLAEEERRRMHQYIRSRTFADVANSLFLAVP